VFATDGDTLNGLTGSGEGGVFNKKSKWHQYKSRFGTQNGMKS
jgi:hypothetical protein